ncbi:hypothetical protein PIB30_076898 [Stylosanthes scabra]|uniref:Uncharacterized protein n=1 Tax=Stylosanthes scabra TaxID=79078 RepID=A0ABU6VRK8_9FABA|nr:hypothetical protein [Stylosanthes scabra]
MHKTIDSVLAREERQDSLVEKSSDLSAASQGVLNLKMMDSVGALESFQVLVLRRRSVP